VPGRRRPGIGAASHPYPPREGRKTPSPQPVDLAEAGLLRKAQGGNLFAFEEIVKRYERRVYATAFRVVRRHDVADDVAQEAFLRAWQSLARFDLARPFGPWVCRIAANLAVNHVRSPEAREEELPEGHGEGPAPGEDPLTQVLDREAEGLLDRALHALPPDQRAVLTLRVVEEMSYKEIAEALAVPTGTVMSRLARARSKLAEALRPYLGGRGLEAGERA
jgi:RNA polymerase sigma-70 factor (ECF subfamily)